MPMPHDCELLQEELFGFKQTVLDLFDQLFARLDEQNNYITQLNQRLNITDDYDATSSEHANNQSLQQQASVPQDVTIDDTFSGDGDNSEKDEQIQSDHNANLFGDSEIEGYENADDDDDQFLCDMPGVSNEPDFSHETGEIYNSNYGANLTDSASCSTSAAKSLKTLKSHGKMHSDKKTTDAEGRFLRRLTSPQPLDLKPPEIRRNFCVETIRYVETASGEAVPLNIAECKMCYKESTGRSAKWNIIDHVLAVHFGRLYQCTQCNHRLANRSHLLRHVREAHLVDYSDHARYVVTIYTHGYK